MWLVFLHMKYTYLKRAFIDSNFSDKSKFFKRQRLREKSLFEIWLMKWDDEDWVYVQGTWFGQMTSTMHKVIVKSNFVLNKSVSGKKNGHGEQPWAYSLNPK